MYKVLELTWQTHESLLVTPVKDPLPLLHTASASCSSGSIFYYLSKMGKEKLFWKANLSSSCYTALKESWHGELLYFRTQEMTQGGPSDSPQDPGKTNSFLPWVQSCPAGMVAAYCVTSASLLES